ncbi:MAG: Hsp20/alpha crystallin family protein [Firmicutes bacterium]|nr:Hsp20/alpha crystallin family protein [Bacillota bacterium]
MLDIIRRTNGQPVPYRSWNLANLGGFSDLFSEFDRLWSEVASSFGRWAESYPVDLYETGEEVVLEMAVPGISKDDLDISLEGRQLTIRGNYNPAASEERRYWLQGIPRGAFSRTLTLPAGLDAAQARAQWRDGILEIRVPVEQKLLPKKVPVELAA